MPFEERHILFYLNELQGIFAEQSSQFKKLDGIKPNDVNITEVAHTSHIKRIPPEQLARFSELIDIPNNDKTTLFYGTRKKLLKETKVCFSLPDSVFTEVLKTACMNQGISLPKGSQRSIIAEDLKVGLRIKLLSQDIELEA